MDVGAHLSMDVGAHLEAGGLPGEQLLPSAVRRSSEVAMERSVVTFEDVAAERDVRPSLCSGVLSGCCRRKRKKQILFNLTGLMKPGLNAIMGPTGSGKSTLLNILAGRINQKYQAGTVLYDGESPHDNTLVSTGYVVQNDQIFGTQTVRENLWLSANLRLPSFVSHYEKRRRIENVISLLSLNSCADSKIGTEYLRGVSGGERKRTCIGMELIIRPNILFLDEPTSGLDASTAQAVMLLLKRLATQGHNIIVSIHQPRYSIFCLFNTLTLLGAGRMLFHGPLQNALPYFKEIGYDCHDNENPADFLLDVAVGDTNALHQGVQQDKMAMTPEQRVMHVQHLAALFRSSSVWEIQNRELQLRLGPSQSKMAGGSINAHPVTSVPYQFCILSRRAFRSILRNPMGLVANIILNIFIGLVFGLLYFQMDLSADAGTQNRFGFLFFVTSNLMFGSFGAIEMFAKERATFLHEHASGYYKVSAYFTAKLVADLLPLRSISPLVFSSVTYWMVGLKPTVEAFLTFLLTVVLLVYSAAGIGMFFSVMCKDFATSSIFIALTFVLSILFDGLLINTDTVVPWLAWLKHCSIDRYAYTALCINEFQNQTFHDCQGNVTLMIEMSGYDEDIAENDTCMVTNGEEFLSTRLAVKMDGDGRLSEWQLWKNHLALGIITASMFLLTYLRLLQLTKKK